MKNNQIVLTKNDIVSIIHNHIIYNSDIAVQFIERVKSEEGIDIVACYLETNETLSDIKSGKLNDTAILTIYARFMTDNDAQIIVASAGDRIFNIFTEILSLNNQTLTYNRSLPPEERILYGFDKTNQWDVAKIIMPSEKPEEMHIVQIDSFDSLVRWHMLSDTAEMLKKVISEMYKLPINVYCSWDENLCSMNHYFSFLDRKTYEFYLRSGKIKEAKKKMFELMKKHDKWSVIDPTVYNPIPVIWNELSPDKKFEFLRQ